MGVDVEQKKIYIYHGNVMYGPSRFLDIFCNR